jgi:MFS family permease
MSDRQNKPAESTKNRPDSGAVVDRASIFSLYLPATVLALGTGIALPVIPVYAKTFDVTFSVASLIIIVPLIGGAVSTIPTGYLIDRIGRRRILIAGPLLTALSSFLVATAGSFPELLIYRFIGGYAQNMWMLSRLAMIADTTASGSRGRQITGMMAMSRGGQLLGPALGGFVGAWDIRVPFLIHGVLALLATIPSFMVKETTTSQSKSVGQGSLSFSQLFVKPVLVLFAVQFLLNMTRGVMRGSLLLYAAYAYFGESLSFGPLGTLVVGGTVSLGILASINAFSGIPITILAGQIMDRFGRKTTMVPGSALLGAGLIFLASTSYFSMPFSAFIAGFLWVNSAAALTFGSMQTMGSDVAPPEARGRFFGIIRLIAETGTFLAPVSFALLFELSGYTVAFAFVGATGLGSALLAATMLRETLQRETPRE